jgi:hypothetical protein
MLLAGVYYKVLPTNKFSGVGMIVRGFETGGRGFVQGTLGVCGGGLGLRLSFFFCGCVVYGIVFALFMALLGRRAL